MDEKSHYDSVAQEMLRGEVKPGVMARALAESDGDREKAKSLYIKYRVNELAEESTRQSTGDTLDLHEPELKPPPPAEKLPKLTAQEAFRKYGIRSLILATLFCWFGYDGWFNTDPKMQEHLGFNRIGAAIIAILLLYALVMFISAAVTVQREKNQPPPPAA